MTGTDLPQVERMFFDIFRSGRAPHPDFASYFRRLFFQGPLARQGGGVVSVGDDGEIEGALSFLPMRFSAHGRQLTARLACAFMVDARQPRAAARIVMAMRARGQDLLFSDSSSPTSAGLWAGGGGVVLPVESLDWHCRFRPLTAGWRRLRAPAALDGVVTLLDVLAARLRPRPPRRRRLTVAEIEAAAFADLVPAMLAHFAVRPDWSREDLLWLLALASENRVLGTLRFFKVTNEQGPTVGCYAAYFGPRGVVRVLDLLALPRQEAEVVEALCATLEAAGTVEAIGMAHPHLLAALSLQRGLHFGHRAFTCVATRHQDIRDAIARNDVYFGGLAGEGWSRLMTDFY